MKFLFMLCLCCCALFCGIQFGKQTKPHLARKQTPLHPIKERKTFVFLIYAYNQAAWVEKSLLSILEQEYDYYRIVFIDDGSQDATFSVAKRCIANNLQEGKVLWIHNPSKLGMTTCLQEGILSALDQEIVIPLRAQDFLTHAGVLSKINQAFQDPNVWMASVESALYPSYERELLECQAFYAALSKQTAASPEKLKEIGQDKIAYIPDVLFFQNQCL
jgi:GT2 family glycosyltransferase